MKKNLIKFQLSKNKSLNSISRFMISGIFLILFFYVTPMFINFAEKNFNHGEFTNNSKNLLLKKLNTNNLIEEDITGEVDDASSIYNLIKDAFPGGSITGAPKLRSMQIIDELEPNNRSVYCGSIGYISFDEKVDLNISIRTMLAVDNNLYFWGGGGIVADSDVKSEYNETISKVKPLLDTFSD